MAGGWVQGNWQEQLKKGLHSAVNIAAATVKQAAEVARDLAEDLTSFRCLKDYKLAGHVATAGPCNTWKIFTAVSKKPGKLCKLDAIIVTHTQTHE